jgi:hypothetical protein
MNNNDIFKEQLVARKNNGKDTLKQIGIVLLGVILIFVGSITIPSLFVPIVLVVGVAVFVIIKRFNLEFEYIFTNGELDIDKIYNKLKRKHTLTIDVRRFIVMIQMTNPSLKSEIGNISKVIDYGKGQITESSYAAIYEDDGKRVQLIFDPNETLIKGIHTYIPRKIK